MAITYEPIATTTLGSTQTTVTFSGIPQTYTDLRVVFNINGTTNNQDIRFRINSDSSTIYDFNFLYTVNGNSPGTYGSTGQNNGGIATTVANNTANQYLTVVSDFMLYASTTQSKSVQSYGGRAGSTNTTGTISVCTSRYNSSSAITALDFFMSGGDFMTGSTFTIYGIKAA